MGLNRSLNDERRAGAFIALSVLLIVASSAYSQDWSAFRGLDRQGVGADTATPVNWSGHEGIRWKTPIKGQGSSSPVVVGDRIFITSAYPAEGREFAKTAYTYCLGGLAILLGLGGVRTVVRSCRVPRQDVSLLQQTGSIAAFLGGVVIVLFFLFFGPSAIDYERCVIRAWLGSSILLGLSVLLTEYQAPPLAWWRPIVGVFGIVYGVLVLVMVPAADHAYAGGLFRAASSTVWVTAMVPFMAGATALFNSWVARRRARQGSAANANPPRLLKIVRALYGFVFLAGMAVAGTVGALIVRQRPAPGEETSWAVRAVPMDELTWWLAGAMPVVLGLVCLMFSGLWNTSPNVEARKGGGALRQVIISIGLCIVGFLVTVYSLSYLVKNSPFLTYHLAKPKWNPLGGWTLVYSGLVGCAVFAVYELYRIRRSGVVGPVVPKGLRLLIIAIAVASFVRVNIISNQVDYTRSIVCLDRSSGRVLWSCEGLTGPEGQLHKINSPASPTPVVQDGRVFAFFGYGGVMCSDVDGKMLWSNPDVRFDSMYGAGVSPIVYKDKLIVVCASPTKPVLYALDGRTGELRWKEAMPAKEGKRYDSGNSRTPIVKNIRGTPTLLVWDFEGLSGHDPESGKRLWVQPMAEIEEGDMVASLVDDGERLYCAGPVETVALDLAKLGAVPDATVWHVRTKGANCCSPIVSHGKLFFSTDGGVATCIDGKKGEILWRNRLGGNYYASPIASGKYVYFTNDEGKTVILDATAVEFAKVAECDWKAPTYASFAPLKDCFIGRTDTHLMCIDGSRTVAERPR